MGRPIDESVALSANELDLALDRVADDFALVIPGDDILVDLLRNGEGNLAILYGAFFDFDFISEEADRSCQLIRLKRERQFEFVRAAAAIWQLPGPSSGGVFAETPRFPSVDLFLSAPVRFNGSFDVVVCADTFVGRCDFVAIAFANHGEEDFVADYFALCDCSFQA